MSTSLTIIAVAVAYALGVARTRAVTVPVAEAAGEALRAERRARRRAEELREEARRDRIAATTELSQYRAAAGYLYRALWDIGWGGVQTSSAQTKARAVLRTPQAERIGGPAGTGAGR